MALPILKALVPSSLSATAAAASRARDWPCFRGPNRNGILDEVLNLLPGGPKKIWEAQVGEGNGSLAVVRGRLYTVARQPENSVVCLDANTGQRLWLTPVKTWFRDATPAVENGRVYVLASQDVPRAYCLDADTGRVLWERELPKSNGDRQYGHAGSPLLWDDVMILNAAGGAALNKSTGEVAWLHEGFPGLATPVLFQSQGRPCVAIFGGDLLIAREARGGKMLWSIPWKTELAVNACDPIIFDSKVFVCSDYGRGRALYDISGSQPKVLWEFGQGKGSSFSSGFLRDGHIFCFAGVKFACLNVGTGEPRWEAQGGGTSALLIGDTLIRVRENGDLIFGRISPARFEELSTREVGMREIKAVPAYSAGKLYLRNEKGQVICLQIGNAG
jgi:outer membrane protein assembly factor BamB